MRTPEISDICQRLWNANEDSAGLLSEIWIEPLFPAKTGGMTLESLPNVHPSLIRQLSLAGIFPLDRQLYEHQVRAVELEHNTRNTDQRPAMIITAGTGAGKTEAFLLPLLNDLFSTPRNPNKNGVRAILIYPLNALVNDQIERLHRWLKGQGMVTVIHYTSEAQPQTDKHVMRSA